MVQYYWNPGMQGVPQPGQMQGQPMQGQPIVPQPWMAFPAQPRGRREESYIENILRLNRGRPATFYFTFDRAEPESGTNVVTIRGAVEAAGRDHAIIRELASNRRFLMPMIYFSYAVYDEEMRYFNQNVNQGGNQNAGQ